MPLRDEDIKSVLDSVVAGVDHDNAAVLAKFAGLPAVIQAREAVRKGDLSGFRFALTYPFDKLVKGLLAQEFPNSRPAQFLVEHSEFVKHQFRQPIQKYEGMSCCADKAGYLIRALLRFYRDGTRIAFDRAQKYTFQLPTRIFTEHDEIVEFFEAVQGLHYGYSDQFVAALKTLEAKAKATAAAVAT